MAEGNITIEELNAEVASTLSPAMAYVGILMVVGIVGNSVVCYIFCFKLHSGTQNFLVICLAVFDLVSCAVAMPTEIVDMKHFYMFESDVACKMLRFVNVFTAISSIFTLLAIAVDRHRNVCRPFAKQMSLHSAHLCLPAILIGSLLVSWPALAIYGIRTVDTGVSGIEGRDCTTSDSASETVFPLLYNCVQLVGFVAVTVILIFFYVRILMETKRHNRYMKHATDFFYVSGLVPMGVYNPSRKVRLISTSQLNLHGLVSEDSSLTTPRSWRGIDNPALNLDDETEFSLNSATINRTAKIRTSINRTDTASVSRELPSRFFEPRDVLRYRSGRSNGKYLISRISEDNLLRKKNSKKRTKKKNAWHKSVSTPDFSLVALPDNEIMVIHAKSEGMPSPLQLHRSSTSSVNYIEFPSLEKVNSGDSQSRIFTFYNILDKLKQSVPESPGTKKTGKRRSLKRLKARLVKSRSSQSLHRTRVEPPLESAKYFKSETNLLKRTDTSSSGLELSLFHPITVDEGIDLTFENGETPVVNKEEFSEISGDRKNTSAEGNGSNSNPPEAVLESFQNSIHNNSKFGDDSVFLGQRSDWSPDTWKEERCVNHRNVLYLRSTDVERTHSRTTSASQESPRFTQDDSWSVSSVVPDSARSAQTPGDYSLLFSPSERGYTDSENGETRTRPSHSAPGLSVRSKSNPDFSRSSSAQGDRAHHRLPRASSLSSLKPLPQTRRNALTPRPTLPDRSLQTTPSTKSSQAPHLNSATPVAVCVTLVFIVSFLPHLCLTLARSVAKDFDHRLSGTGLVLFNIFLRSYLVNSALNPFVYGWLNHQFRHQCLQILRFGSWRCCCCQCSSSSSSSC